MTATILACLIATLFVGCSPPTDTPSLADDSPAIGNSLSNPDSSRRADAEQDVAHTSVPDSPAAPAAPRAPAPPVDPSDTYFADARVRQLRIEVSAPQMQRLREDARRYVPGRLVEDDSESYDQVGVRLKGAAGSFREVDDRPAFTLNVNWMRDNQSFHGLTKFHLNNSVQDESYLCEWTCAELCRIAGIPATRVSFARVWLNERDLGLYVLKEGFDRRFLRRHFESPDGNLYDGGFLQDVDVNLERDAGRGPDDFSDLQALTGACREGDLETRWRLMAERLDVDRFLTFMAFERFTCHWDGYTQNRNNYRIYFDPPTGRAHFLPHGMDQMFGDIGFPMLGHSDPIVASAVLQNPAWRVAYRRRVEQLLPQYSVAQMHAIVDRAVERLRPVFEERGPDEVRQHEERVADFKRRLAERWEHVRNQLRDGEPLPLEFDEAGRHELTDWEMARESEDARLETRDVEGRGEWSVEVGPSGHCVASWRRRVLLSQGVYRFEADVATRDVEALEHEPGAGAGLRFSGGRRDHRVDGTVPWRRVSHTIEVTEPQREFVLVMELRASRGTASFRNTILRRGPP